jgi:hypothetical protein
VPTRLLLEGPDIEALLIQIRDEHGGAAKIVSADKVRRGGVGGFFAKQCFEIEVEVDDKPPARPAAGARPAGARPARARPADPPAADPPAADPPAADRPAADPPIADLMADLVDLADAAESRYRLPSADLVAPRVVEPGGADLGAAVAADHGTNGRPAGNGAANGRAGNGAAPSMSDSDFTSLLRSLRVEMDEPFPRGPAAGPAAASAPVRAGRSQPLAAAYGVVAGRHCAEPAAPAGSPQWRPAVPPAVPPPPSRLPEALTALGVPPELAARADHPDRYVAVVRAMSDLPPPPPPPTRPGDVLVVVGETGPALAVATVVAEQIGIDPAQTLVAAPTPAGSPVAASHRVCTAGEADRRGRELHLGDTAALLVLAAPLERVDTRWTRSILEALRPTAVWGVVDATRKPADLAAYLDLIGPLDAIAVHATGASRDPATVLGLELPVSYLDGRPANAAAWAGLLCERLAWPA